MPIAPVRTLLHPPKKWALYFDGVDDYVEVANDPSLFSSKMTIIAWVKSLETRNERIVISHGLYNLYGWYWWMPLGDIWGFAYNKDGDSSTSVLFPYAEFAGSWKMLSTAVDNDNLKVYAYINDSLVKTAGMAFAMDPPNCPLRIGRYSGNGYSWRGHIASVMLYNRLLNSSEIQHNYLNPMSPILDGLVLWLKMEEGSGTTVHDYSGYGNDGTIYGASWTEITHDPVRTLSPVRILSPVR